MIETVEYETCCLAFTATSDGRPINKLTTFRPTTLPRRMKSRPRARCNARCPFQTSAIAVVASTRHYDGGSNLNKHIFRRRCHEEVYQRKRPRYALGQHQLNRQFFCHVSGLFGRAAQQTWWLSALCREKLTQPVPGSTLQETRC